MHLQWQPFPVIMYVKHKMLFGDIVALFKYKVFDA